MSQKNQENGHRIESKSTEYKVNRESLVMSECSTLAQDFTSWPESPEAKLTLCWAGAQKKEASTHTQADGGGRDQTAPRMVML